MSAFASTNSLIGTAIGQPLLDVRGLSVWLGAGSNPVIDDVSFSLSRGEVLGLVGESGSGKSMTARSIAGVLPATHRTGGSIFVNGVDLTSSPASIARRVRATNIGFINQDPGQHIDPLWPVEDYVCAALRDIKHLSRTKALSAAIDLLRSVGIDDPRSLLRRYSWELSGGMLQRVAIAAALAMDPDLLIADEATTALDVTIQADVMGLLSELQDIRSLGLLFITHDLALASAICDRILVMYAGRILEAQPTRELFACPIHPYTRLLLNARPSVDGEATRRELRFDSPIDRHHAPDGCPFAPRCEWAKARCSEAVPAFREVVPNGWSRCIRFDEIKHELSA